MAAWLMAAWLRGGEAAFWRLAAALVEKCLARYELAGTVIANAFLGAVSRISVDVGAGGTLIAQGDATWAGPGGARHQQNDEEVEERPLTLGESGAAGQEDDERPPSCLTSG